MWRSHLMRICWWAASLWVALLCLSGAMPLLGDHEAVPRRYVIVTKNRKFLFVMLPPPYLRREFEPDKYPASGLYPNDGSTRPIWTVEWYSWGRDVDISGDGVHLVRW